MDKTNPTIMNTFTINGVQYTRRAEIISGEGEDRIEKISWHSPIGELFDKKSLELLETNYLNICQTAITPELPII